MTKLNPDDLVVHSFETSEPIPSEPVAPVTRETNEDPLCWSPLCGPTFWKTCDTGTAA